MSSKAGDSPLPTISRTQGRSRARGETVRRAGGAMRDTADYLARDVVGSMMAKTAVSPGTTTDATWAGRISYATLPKANSSRCCARKASSVKCSRGACR